MTNSEAIELSRLLAGMKNPPPKHRQHSFDHETLKFLHCNLYRCDPSSFGYARAQEIIANGLAECERLGEIFDQTLISIKP